MDKKLRPEWRHKTTEEFARWLYNNPIVKITHHWEMTGEDASEEWMMLHPKEGPARKAPSQAYEFGGFGSGEIRFILDNKGLVSLNHYVADTICKIIQWEQENERKLAEYNKLKDELGL